MRSKPNATSPVSEDLDRQALTGKNGNIGEPMEKMWTPPDRHGSESLQGNWTSVVPSGAKADGMPLNGSLDDSQGKDDIAGNQAAAEGAQSVHVSTKAGSQKGGDAKSGTNGRGPEDMSGDVAKHGSTVGPEHQDSRPSSRSGEDNRDSSVIPASLNRPRGYIRDSPGPGVHGDDMMMQDQGSNVGDKNRVAVAPRDKPGVALDTSRTSTGAKPSLAENGTMTGSTVRTPGWLQNANVAVDGRELARVPLGAATGAVAALEGPGMEPDAMPFTGHKYMLIVGVLKVGASKRCSVS
jgi:hypothetical protein